MQRLWGEEVMVWRDTENVVEIREVVTHGQQDPARACAERLCQTVGASLGFIAQHRASSCGSPWLM